MTIKTFNTIAIVVIAITLVTTTIILPMVEKVQSDFSTISKTLANG